MGKLPAPGAVALAGLPNWAETVDGDEVAFGSRPINRRPGRVRGLQGRAEVSHHLVCETHENISRTGKVLREPGTTVEPSCAAGMNVFGEGVSLALLERRENM